MTYKILKNKEIELIALQIVKDLKNAGHKETYFVGGYVRDKLLSIKSEKTMDIDIATEARPNEIKEVFKKEKFLEIGEAFNIIILIIKGYKFEIATFREDIFENDRTKWDGRYPKAVTYATSEDDAKRRDFTVNAIFFDPIEKKHLDFVGGMKDINNKIIRTIGEPQERFREDYLRMLRAIRFAVEKSFRIDQVLFNTIKKYSDKIISISKERIYSELTKIFMSASPSEGLLFLNETKLLKWIYLYNNKKREYVVLNNETLDFSTRCLDNAPEKLLIRWVIFFHLLNMYIKNISEIKNKMIENKFDNKTIGKIIWILENKISIDNWERISKYEKMEIAAHSQFENLFLFFKVEEKTKEETIVNYISSNPIKKIEESYKNFKKDKTRWDQMKKFTVINGNDLLKIGIEGKKIGNILKEVKKKYMLEELEDREAIIKYINDIK